MQIIDNETPQQRYKRLYPERVKISLNKYKKSIKGINTTANFHYKQRFGITLEERDERIKNQDNKCIICNLDFTKINKPCIDHDHHCCSSYKTCGKCVRDIICHRCNKVLGFVNENIKVLQNIISYLEKYDRNN